MLYYTHTIHNSKLTFFLIGGVDFFLLHCVFFSFLPCTPAHLHPVPRTRTPYPVPVPRFTLWSLSLYPFTPYFCLHKTKERVIYTPK